MMTCWVNSNRDPLHREGVGWNQTPKFKETTPHATSGTFVISSELGNAKRPSCYVQHCGHERIKFNNDTGAVTPINVTNGQAIPNFGRAMFQTVDSFGIKGTIQGQVT